MRRSSKPIAILATSAVLVGGAVAHAATGSDGSDSTAADPAATATTPGPDERPGHPGRAVDRLDGPRHRRRGPGPAARRRRRRARLPERRLRRPVRRLRPARAGARLDGTGHDTGADDARHGHDDHHAGPVRPGTTAPATGDGPVPGGGAVVVDRPPSVVGR